MGCRREHAEVPVCQRSTLHEMKRWRRGMTLLVAYVHVYVSLCKTFFRQTRLVEKIGKYERSRGEYGGSANPKKNFEDRYDGIEIYLNSIFLMKEY